MQEIKIRKAIRFFGNITNMAHKIGVSRTSIIDILKEIQFLLRLLYGLKLKVIRKLAIKN